MKRFVGKKPGFTLIELVVVIVIMSILAGAGLVGLGGMVSSFSAQSCAAARQEAVRAYISDWMEGELQPGSTGAADWLKDYLAQNQAKDGGQWTITVTGAAGSGAPGWQYTVTIACPRHSAEPVTAAFGPPELK